MRKTKIICTLGPASASREIIRAMIGAGMNVARFNFSHGTHESHLALFTELNKVRNEMGVAVATILDTKGPEVRIGTLREGRILLNAGDLFDLVSFETEGDQHLVVSRPARMYLLSRISRQSCKFLFDLRMNILNAILYNKIPGSGFII